MIKVIISCTTNSETIFHEFQLASIPDEGECVYFIENKKAYRISIGKKEDCKSPNPLRGRAFFDGGAVYLKGYNLIEITRNNPDYNYNPYLDILGV
ncbi:hypothetical protein VB796_06435 [Arcicella sp. LKC2W]|uniref:hypothetical protein n=1 Tax=Arcicella sp. LKC2W TaxID=2984198 RepID=UPI002B1FBF3F|nr:hypothetical protein [Arcicella sp. LKC2W]MEA5458664.1 hypothetical protein [Arcicella sp. LKC2W]